MFVYAVYLLTSLIFLLFSCLFSLKMENFLRSPFRRDTVTADKTMDGGFLFRVCGSLFHACRSRANTKAVPGGGNTKAAPAMPYTVDNFCLAKEQIVRFAPSLSLLPV